MSDRARGVMVGLAAGNLLGAKFEGAHWTSRRIQREHPDGVTEIRAWPTNPDDDDLAQAIVLADACTGVEQLDIEDFTKRLWVWGELNGLGMGPHTKRVLTRYGGDKPRREIRNEVRFRKRPSGEWRPPMGVPALEASRGAWEASGQSKHGYNAGNGAAMRCAPVAIRWWYDDTEVVRNSVVSAAATHWDPRCLWAAALINLTIASLLRGRGKELQAERLLQRGRRALRALPEICELFDLDADEPPRRITQATHQALTDGCRLADFELEGDTAGYVINTYACAIWAAKHTQSFERGLSDVVSAGGDTDTNAAAAGAVLGAKFGLSGIPSRWRERINEIRAYNGPRSKWPPRAPLEGYADRLLEVNAQPQSSMRPPSGMSSSSERGAT